MKKSKKLNLDERIKIEINYCNNNKGIREMGRMLGRDPGTISREIGDKTRHGVNRYKAYVAHNKALETI